MGRRTVGLLPLLAGGQGVGSAQLLHVPPGRLADPEPEFRDRARRPLGAAALAACPAARGWHVPAGVLAPPALQRRDRSWRPARRGPVLAGAAGSRAHSAERARP